MLFFIDPRFKWDPEPLVSWMRKHQAKHWPDGECPWTAMFLVKTSPSSVPHPSRLSRKHRIWMGQSLPTRFAQRCGDPSTAKTIVELGGPTHVVVPILDYKTFAPNAVQEITGFPMPEDHMLRTLETMRGGMGVYRDMPGDWQGLIKYEPTRKAARSWPEWVSHKKTIKALENAWYVLHETSALKRDVERLRTKLGNVPSSLYAIPEVQDIVPFLLKGIPQSPFAERMLQHQQSGRQ
jgi:hypothetical protein